MTSTVKIKTKQKAAAYEIRIAGGSLASSGIWAASVLSGTRGRVAVISNKKVFRLYGDQVIKSLSAAGFATFVHLIGDGEKFKNLRTLEATLKFLSISGISRTDAVMALGGGVVGDLAGFAASIYLRGIDFLQVPTTLLSMIDSSVGGKTGVNSSFGKNLIGAFYQPRGVLIDTDVLTTLPQRELTAGFCEAVKQGAIGGRKLFDKTADFLEDFDRRKLARGGDNAAFRDSLVSMLSHQVSFKARIVAGDEREDAAKMDVRSRKILNFGHTLGHALEKVTDYRYFKHGEAVGHGVCFAAELSKNLGLLAQDEVKLLNDVVRRAGNLPPLTGIDPRQVFATFKYDKKLINNSLHWILLKKIGEPVIFPHSEIPQAALMSAFKTIARN